MSPKCPKFGGCTEGDTKDSCMGLPLTSCRIFKQALEQHLSLIQLMLIFFLVYDFGMIVGKISIVKVSSKRMMSISTFF